MKKEDIKNMRHEVIELAISLENFLDEEIMTYFGVDAWDASYYMQIERQRNIFYDSFLRYMSFPNKIKLIKAIIRDIGEKLDCQFGKDANRFVEIRNKFAHTFYPEIDEESMPKMKIDLIKTQQKNWEQMYKELKILYRGIVSEIDRKFYSENPRQRKYRRFEERQLLKVIRHYEEIIEKNSKK